MDGDTAERFGYKVHVIYSLSCLEETLLCFSTRTPEVTNEGAQTDISAARDEYRP